MLPVVITAKRRRWLRRSKTWRRLLPERWSEVREQRRLVYFSWQLLDPTGAPRRILRDVLQLPRWAFQALSVEEVAAMAGALAWMRPRPNSADPVIGHFTYKRKAFYLPKPNGWNLACLEYPLADDYYGRFLASQDPRHLACLVAVLCREGEADQARILARGDRRVPLLSRAEAEARADRLKGLPAETAYAVLYYFAGLKEYVARTYGQYLFDEDDDEEEDPGVDRQDGKKPQGPNFGWWGIYQQVAEAGLFGTLKEVYQASFHEICIYLVRQAQKEESMRSPTPAPAKTEDDD